MQGQHKLGIIDGLGLGRREVPDRLEEEAVVEPVDPFEGGELDRFEAAHSPSRRRLAGSHRRRIRPRRRVPPRQDRPAAACQAAHPTPNTTAQTGCQTSRPPEA